MERMMICTKGEKYDTDTLRFTGWTVGDGTSTEGYSAWTYFDREGRYLGPDEHGIEPEFENAGYTLISTKGREVVTGALASVFRAAIDMEKRLQPACGVSIECPDGQTYECRDGRIAVYAEAGDDSEDGAVVLVDDALMIAWEQGARTPFSNRGLIPG